MSNNNNKNKLKQTPDSFDIQLARLIYIGSTISTLGGGLQTLAAALALNALEKASSQNSQSSQSSQTRNEQSKQPEDLEMQIDSIIKELKQIKRMMK